MKGRIVEIDSFQEVEVEGRAYTVWYIATGKLSFTPGRFSGPPEDCYPDEGECELEGIAIYQIAAIGLPPADHIFQDKEMKKTLRDALDEEKIEEELWEAYHSGD